MTIKEKAIAAYLAKKITDAREDELRGAAAVEANVTTLVTLMNTICGVVIDRGDVDPTGAPAKLPLWSCSEGLSFCLHPFKGNRGEWRLAVESVGQLGWTYWSYFTTIEQLGQILDRQEKEHADEL